MATKRRKIPPSRINEPPPAWAQRLLAGERPECDSYDYVEAFGWYFMGDVVPGLPDGDSGEALEIWRRASDAD